MSEKRDRDRERRSRDDPEDLKEILSVVSSEVPSLIKNILSSVFSEEAGRSMGKAAGAFYKELKESGMQDEVALKMTQDYMGTFTSLGTLIKQIGKGKSGDIDISKVIHNHSNKSDSTEE
jgi:hypothetical protein